MGFLPIVERELRVAARSPVTHRSRLMTGAVAAVGVLWLAAAFNRAGAPGGAGRSLFASIEHIFYYWCFVAGLTSTLDSVSSEKREGTLGLLFLTPLRGFDIVAGKLAMGSLGTLFAFMAALPALAITVLSGGVAGSALWISSIALLNTLFFALSLGLLLSVLTRDPQRLMGFGIAFGILSGNALPAALRGLEARGWGGGWVTAIEALNPYSAVRAASAAGVTGQWAPFGWFLLMNHLAAWACIGLASWRLPRSWQDRPARVASTALGARIRDWRLGSPERRQEFRRHWLDRDPITWLLNRERFQETALWVSVILSVLLAAWLMLTAAGASVIGFAVVGVLILTLNLLIKLRATGDSAFRWAADRDSGALEMLAVTPLRVEELVAGQVRALGWHRSAGPIAASLAAQILFGFWALASATADPGWSQRQDFVDLVARLVGGFVVATILLFLDLGTLWRIGLWSALKARTRAKATHEAFHHVFVLPCLGMLATLSVLLFCAVPVSYWLFLILWTGWGIAADLFACARARHELQRDFLKLVTQRFQPVEPGLLGRMGRQLGVWWKRQKS